MGNKRSRRSRRLETPSPNREEGVETPNPGNMTLTNSNLVNQENLGPNILANQITEPSVISNERQVWTQEMEKRNNDRIEKMREEIDNKFDAILREIKTSKNASTITNPRSESNETQNNQPSGSRNRSIGVRAPENENSDSENEDNHPIRASNMHELRDPARPFCQNRFELDETLVSNEDSEEEDYHMVTGANRQLHRQSSQNPQSLNDTTGSHAAQNTTTSSATPLDPVNQIALAIEKLANKNESQTFFHPKNTLTFNGKNEKNEKFEYFEDLFHTTLRMQPNLTEDMKINHFHAHLRGLALKTLKTYKERPQQP